MLNEHFCLTIYPIIRIQLLLQLYDSLVSLIQSTSKCNHDIALFKQQLLVAIDLLFVLFNLYSFLLNFLHLLVVLFANDLLLRFQCISELRRVFNLLATNKHLAVHGANLGLQ